jgi:hypothetical protein
MSGDRWGLEGPPEEAYGRVTRDLATLYAPLHDTVREMVDELVAHYDVEHRAASDAERARVEGCVSDLRETTVLAPRSPDQSPLIVGQCDLPGVHVAYGRWASGHLPPCGCDACDEALEDLVDEFSEVRRVVTGGFGEWVRREGSTWWLGLQDGASSLDRAERRALGITEPVEIAWQPWSRRDRPADPAPDARPVR